MRITRLTGLFALLAVLAAPQSGTAQDAPKTTYLEVHEVALTDLYVGRTPRFHCLSSHLIAFDPATVVEKQPLPVVKSITRRGEPIPVTVTTERMGERLEVLITVAPERVRRSREDTELATPFVMPDEGLVCRSEYFGWDLTPHGLGQTWYIARYQQEQTAEIAALTAEDAVSIASTTLLTLAPGEPAIQEPLSFLSRLPLPQLLAPRDLLALRNHLRVLAAPSIRQSRSMTRGGRFGTLTDDTDSYFELTKAMAGDLEVLERWERMAIPFGTEDPNSYTISLDHLHIGALTVMYKVATVPEYRGRCGLLALQAGRSTSNWDLLEPLIADAKSGHAILPGDAQQQEKTMIQLERLQASQDGFSALMMILIGASVLIAAAFTARTVARRILFS